MRNYRVNGIDLWIPRDAATRKLHEALVSERYESTEAAALQRHLRPDDRLLDLGSGAGYLVALAAKTISGASIQGLEADEAMAKVAQQNLDRNGNGGGRVAWGAVVADTFAAATVTLNVGRAFWASTVADVARRPAAEKVQVPAIRLGTLLASHCPTLVTIDIEGGELALFDAPLPESVRLIVMEIHPAIYGAAGVKRVFDGLSVSGMAYNPLGSRGSTVVFERVV